MAMITRSTYNPGQGELAYINKANTRIRDAAAFWRNTYDWWRILLRNYDMEYDLVRDSEGNIVYPYASRVFAPFTFEKMEIEIPLIVSMTLDHDPPFAAVKGRPGQDEEGVKRTEALLTYQLRNRGFKPDMIRAIQQIVKIGNQIFRIRWRQEKQRITDRWTESYLGIESGIGKEQREVIAYDGPDFYLLPFYRFHIDPYTPPCDLQKARYLGYEDVLTWEDFLSEAKYLEYENVKFVEAAVFSSDTKPDSVNQSGGTLEQTDIDERVLPGDAYAHDVHLYYYWDRKDIITTAKVGGGAGILLKRDRFEDKCGNGKYPFYALFNRIHTDKGVEASTDAQADHHPGGFYPPGDLQPLHGVQAAINTTINQRIDNVTLGLRNPIIIRSGALEDEYKLAEGWTQNPILHLQGELQGHRISEVLEQIKFQDMFGASWSNQMDKLEEWGDRALGTFESVRGQSSPAVKTATGFMQATQNAVKRMALKVYIMTTMGLAEMLTDMSDMNADLIGPRTRYYVTGSSEPLFINPEEVVRGVAYTIRTIPPYSKQLMSEQAMQAIPILSQYYPYANVKRLVETWLEGQEWLENVEEIIPKEAPQMNFLQLRAILAGNAMMPEMFGAGGPGANREGKREGAIGESPELDAAKEIRKIAGLGR
jgi:hypothetical protein